MSERTAREVLDAMAMLPDLECDCPEHILASRVEKVLALHKQSDSTFADRPWCCVCKDAQNNHVDWPCPTVRILNGEQP